jgi:L-ascorbate metabolism protein UlaG (beta-lactamase superfamily)
MYGSTRSFVAVSLVLTLGLAAAGVLHAQPGKIEVLWLGQAATRITSVSGKVIVIDPFLTQNPKTPAAYKNLDALGKVDLILVTHAHGDHLGDGPELAKKHSAPLWGPAGLDQSLLTLGVLPAELALRMNKGGTITPLGHFVMSPKDAAVATEMIKPKFAIPIHYGTFPPLKGTPQEYMQALGTTSVKVFPINPGDKRTFP